MLKVDKWITFTDDLLPLVMDGRKTVTRRIVRPQPYGEVKSATLWKDGLWRIEHQPVAAFVGQYVGLRVRCPYGKPGDILGIKEGYRIGVGSALNGYVHGHYSVDGEGFHRLLTSDEWKKWQARKFPYRRTPGRFMYRSLCRARLLNRGVRVEQVQDITTQDALAEGIKLHEDITPRVQFAELWDKINKARGFGWDVNPWVWRVEFEVME